MIPLYCYIYNFQGHSQSEIDFTAFSSALVIGKVCNNELVANGVGKTSIFRAIEYVLFNQVRDPLLQKDIVLEKLIRDDTNKVSVIFDFAIGEEVFRIIRSRTRKGVSDLSFYRRNAVEGLAHTPETDKELWDDISSRRTQDTEDDLAKKIKSNYKSFINTNHFMQNDFYGIATATPEKRKALLKETLGLMIYGKLEEQAKEKASAILKQIEKSRTELQFLGNPQEDIDSISKQLTIGTEQYTLKFIDLEEKRNVVDKLNERHSALLSQLNVLESQASAVIAKRDSLASDVGKLDTSINDYTYKTKSLSKIAKLLLEEISVLKQELTQLNTQDIDLDKTEALLVASREETDSLSKGLGDIEANIRHLKNDIAALDQQLTSLPNDNFCTHCQQTLTAEHRQTCQAKNQTAKTEAETKLDTLIIDQSLSTAQYKAKQEAHTALKQQKQQINSTIFNISFKTKELSAKESEVQEKRKAYDEYTALIAQFTADLTQKKAELLLAETEVQNSSAQEINALKLSLLANKTDLQLASDELSKLTKDLADLQAHQAVLQHSLQQKTADIIRKTTLQTEITAAESEYTIYPSIIQAFGSSGIPNLIIQNMLEDLQTEANSLLTQIRPGLQLLFSTEKTKADGATAETLEINYFLNNKPRDYSQLSGAQRLCITFSLKLGLSFLLAKRFGAQVKFLLLDEIDQSLDKASTDALADIIKYFQKDFKILVITHSDRLQSKVFSHAILVEQDQNMVSTAKVVNSW